MFETQRAMAALNLSRSTALLPESPIEVLLRTEDKVRSLADTQELHAREINDLRQSLSQSKVLCVALLAGGAVH